MVIKFFINLQEYLNQFTVDWPMVGSIWLDISAFMMFFWLINIKEFVRQGDTLIDVAPERRGCAKFKEDPSEWVFQYVACAICGLFIWPILIVCAIWYRLERKEK